MNRDKKCSICQRKCYAIFRGTVEFCSVHYLQMFKQGKVLKVGRLDKNEYVDCGDYYEICLYNRRCEEVARAKISKDRFDEVKNFRWSQDHYGYIRCHKLNKKLHQLLLKAPQGLEIDHINRDKTDNRTENLRIVDRSTNVINKDITSRNKTGIVGVEFYKPTKKWKAAITKSTIVYHLGYFKKFKDAVKARKNAELKYH